MVKCNFALVEAQLVKNPAMQETQFDSWVGKIPWRTDRLPILVFMGFPGGCWAGKVSACNGGDLGLIPGLERSPGGGHGNPLQCSCLEDPHGQKSPWGHEESDMTEQLTIAQHILVTGRNLWKAEWLLRCWKYLVCPHKAFFPQDSQQW